MSAFTGPGASTPAQGEVPAGPAGGHDALQPRGLAARRRVEIELLTRFGVSQGHGRLAPARVEVSGGSSVHVDGVDAARSLFVEAHAYAEALDPSQTVDMVDLVQDLFKLALVARTHPRARAVLLLGGEQAVASVRTIVRTVPSLQSVELVAVD